MVVGFEKKGRIKEGLSFLVWMLGGCWCSLLSLEWKRSKFERVCGWGIKSFGGVMLGLR